MRAYHVDAVIFDLGGVLLNIDYSLTAEAFETLGYSRFDRRFSHTAQDPLFDDFETGKIGEADFFAELQHQAPGQVKLKDLEKAWNAMLLDFPREKLDWVRQTRKQHKIFLLSNTNPTHVRAFTRILRKQHGLESLDALFDHVYFSHLVGLRKPDPEIFQLVLREQNLEAGSTLFIDDTEQHIRAAAGLGIKTRLVAQ